MAGQVGTSHALQL